MSDFDKDVLDFLCLILSKVTFSASDPNLIQTAEIVIRAKTQILNAVQNLSDAAG